MPVQFATYCRRGTTDEFRFIGFAEQVHEEVPATEDVCLMAPVISGFTMAERGKKTPEHTVYQIVTQEEFDKVFELVTPPIGRNTEGVKEA